VISLPFDSKGLKFYYQGPLTEEEIAQGIVRPEEVVGSYAVYHESKKDREYTQERLSIFIDQNLLTDEEIGLGQS